ncbi:DNA methyltransferase [Methylobacillus sp. Pita2]|uniref:DNA methyltransferase n=1 Tax=Methylobacillus sp. Pita2 TaxID=3383245 RepID=UPI0038B61008
MSMTVHAKPSRPADTHQLALFTGILAAYAANDDAPLDNKTLYRMAVKQAGLPESVLDARVSIGGSHGHNLMTRKIRWFQQTLKAAGVIERIPGKRGLWKLTQPNKDKLNQIDTTLSVLGFSTRLGVAILGSCETFFKRIDTPVHLVVTSPPYPLQNSRDYGNPSEAEFVDWMCRMLEPVVKNLVPGGSICLNISNDIFIKGLPARSLYRERLILALHDRLGLYKMDELIWESNKAPGPAIWASKTRTQLNVAYEPVYWLTNDPSLVASDNRRVLQPHSKEHQKFIAAGGQKHRYESSNGAYVHLPGSYSAETKGKIPRNVIKIGNADFSQRAYKRMAIANGLPAHGAPMPLKLAKFLIEFLTKPGEVVVDPFGGSFTTPLAAELLGRAWMATELVAEYVLGGALRFKEFMGYQNHLKYAA